MRRFILLLCILALVPKATAVAPPKKSPAAQSSPATPNDLPIQTTTKNNNVRVYALGLLVGWLSADVDFKISKKWTIGPSVTYWQTSLGGSTVSSGGTTSNYDVKFYRAGVRANWFKNGAYTDGLYLAPSLDYRYISLKATDVYGPITGSGTNFTGSGLVGYGWFWESFNMLLGAGAMVNIGQSRVEAKSTTSSSSQSYDTNFASAFTFEYCLGWTF